MLAGRNWSANFLITCPT